MAPTRKMDKPQSYIAATLIVLLVVVAFAWVWFNYIKHWKQIDATGGDKLSFDTIMKTPAWLRFRNCKFTTQSPAGEVQTWDVTAVLNGMAAAHQKEATGAYPTQMNLGGGAQAPLNPFSFIKTGFNDTQTVPTATLSEEWAKVPDAATRLTGEWTVL